MKNELIRKQLGLTQERLAWWLGITREVLAQVETGRRTLPLESGLQDARLVLATLGLVPSGGPAAPQAAPAPLPAPAVDTRPLVQRVHYCRLQVMRLQQELAAMQAKAARYSLRLKVLPALRAWNGPVPDHINEADWLRILEHEAISALRDECGAGPQGLLAARIAGLEREIERLEQLQAELPGA